MGNPVVHFEIRADDPDAARDFYGKLFGWTFPAGGIPGYTYVETGVPDAIPGGIGPTQGGSDLVTVFIGVEDVEASLRGGGAARRHDRAAGHARSRASPSGCSPTRRGTWSASRRKADGRRRGGAGGTRPPRRARRPATEEVQVQYLLMIYQREEEDAGARRRPRRPSDREEYERFNETYGARDVLRGGAELQPTDHGDHRARAQRRGAAHGRPVRRDQGAARRLLRDRVRDARRGDRDRGRGPGRALTARSRSVRRSRESDHPRPRRPRDGRPAVPRASPGAPSPSSSASSATSTSPRRRSRTPTRRRSTAGRARGCPTTPPPGSSRPRATAPWTCSAGAASTPTSCACSSERGHPMTSDPNETDEDAAR